MNKVMGKKEPLMTQKKNIHVNDSVNLRPLSYVREKYAASINRVTYQKGSKETEQNYAKFPQ
jgi:hypothetical protein